MRRYLLLLIFVLCFCFASSEAQARKLALLVGVDDYANVPSLKCCVNDMKTLKAALIKIGFDNDDIQMLVTGSNSVRELPTKKKIEQSISDILSQAQSTDMVFFAFSGHGAQERGIVYFCPPFADPEDLDNTCVSITKIMDDLAKSRAKFKWMVVDACRNDPTQGPKGIGGKGLQVVPTPPAGIALFQSCAEGEESWEDRASGNGYFTKNLAAALSGSADADRDGQLTLLEVCKWTTSQTKAEVEKTEHKTQRPYFSGTVHDFTLSEDLNVPKAKKLVEEARKAVEDENYELAVKKYDEAIALCPRYNSIKRERNTAKKLLNAENWVREAEQKRREGEERKWREDAEKKRRAEEETKQRQVGNSVPGTRAGERKVVTVNGVKFAFRWCPAGTFMMGSPERYDWEEQHRVTLTKGFWMMETEVTQKQWKAVMGNNPSKFKGDDLPVERVSWDDCQEFCKKCTQLGLPVQLPTEAQWEYACRAGTTGAYAGNLDKMAWYYDNSRLKTHPVGTKKPNAWGLYDMHGNVLEWCADWFGNYTSGRSVIESSCSRRVIRGGSWVSHAHYCRSACRDDYEPGNRGSSLGFRALRGQ